MAELPHQTLLPIPPTAPQSSRASPLSGLQRLLGDMRGELWRFLVARTGDPVEADDLLQDMWLRIGGAGEGPIANGRGYLFRMAHNLVLDRVRDRQRRVRRERDWVQTNQTVGTDELIDQRASAFDQLVDQQETAALAAAITRLPQRAGEVFRLHKIDGLSHQEIASRLGISRSGVEKHIASAMAQLRRAVRY